MLYIIAQVIDWLIDQHFLLVILPFTPSYMKNLHFVLSYTCTKFSNMYFYQSYYKWRLPNLHGDAKKKKEVFTKNAYRKLRLLHNLTMPSIVSSSSCFFFSSKFFSFKCFFFIFKFSSFIFKCFFLWWWWWWWGWFFFNGNTWTKLYTKFEKNKNYFNLFQV